jgi:predicted phosphohydrolase
MTTIWAIADLHLALSCPEKEMSVFGKSWENYTQRIQENWQRVVKNDDLVLIAGDISWAMRLEEALIDLEWIDRLPGKKLISRGNHDYWWTSLTKMNKVMPSSLHALAHSSFTWNDVSICATRLWDTPEFSFDDYILKTPNPRQSAKKEEEIDSAKIYERELGRLEIALKSLDSAARLRIAMVHYPPIGPLLQPSRASQLLEKYGVSICVFGHLHNVDLTKPLFVKQPHQEGTIDYLLTSADYLNFTPKKVVSG